MGKIYEKEGTCERITKKKEMKGDGKERGEQNAKQGPVNDPFGLL